MGFRSMLDTIFEPRFFRRIASFSMIGIINTVIHLAAMLCLVELMVLNPVLANCLAFIAANIFSFYANSRWNYRTHMLGSRYRRFLIVSLAGLAITACVSGIADALGFHYLVGTTMVFVALPVLTFIAHHYWTWGE